MKDFPMGLDDMPEPIIAPLDPLSAEWNVVGKFSFLLLDLPQRTLNHVRGHQDRTVHYQSLSLLSSQLNVDADSLANQYQSEYLRNENEWSKYTRERVNWNAHGVRDIKLRTSRHSSISGIKMSGLSTLAKA